MKNQSTPVLKVSLLLLFLIVMIPSCTKDLNQTTDDPYSSPITPRYTTKSPDIDLNLLSQLRQDSLYNEFISRTSYTNTKELIDSLKYYSQNKDTSAYNRLSTQQLPAQQQNRQDKLLLEQKYKVSISNYLIYEYNQGRQLCHKATKANSNDIIIRHPEGLVRANQIIREFGITYSQGLYHCFHSRCSCNAKGQYLGVCIDAALQYMGTCSISSYRAFEAIKDASEDFCYELTESPFSYYDFEINVDPFLILDMIEGDIIWMRQSGFLYFPHDCGAGSCPNCIWNGLLHGEKYIGDGSTGTRPNPGGGDHNDQCSDRKCEKCGGCVNPSKGDCGACTCPKKCDDEMCPVCEGCLAGIGGRPAAVATRAAVTHKKCTCPVLCEECGETQKDPQTGESLCLYKETTGKNYNIYSPYYLNGENGYRMIWNDSNSNNIELGGYLLESGFIAINTDRSTNTAIHCALGKVEGCRTKGKYILFLSEPTAEEKSVIKAPLHTHLHVNHYHYIEISGKYGMYAENLLVSDGDIYEVTRLPTIDYGLILSKGVVFRYTKLAKANNEFCRMCDLF